MLVELGTRFLFLLRFQYSRIKKRCEIHLFMIAGNTKRASRRRPATVGTQFKISIGALINNLGSKVGGRISLSYTKYFGYGTVTCAEAS